MSQHQCLPDPEIQFYHQSQQQQPSQIQQGPVNADAVALFTLQDEDPSEVLGRIEAELLTMLHSLHEGRVEMSVVICLCAWAFGRATFA